ncbi:MAG TPA: hypothetical protein VG167_00890 [Verrucomicrobiae bacterium]|nr:hypothetical protein [Verrucomicrobiae bacterium]
MGLLLLPVWLLLIAGCTVLVVVIAVSSPLLAPLFFLLAAGALASLTPKRH